MTGRPSRAAVNLLAASAALIAVGVAARIDTPGRLSGGNVPDALPFVVIGLLWAVSWRTVMADTQPASVSLWLRAPEP